MARKKHNGIYYDDQTDYQNLINNTDDYQKKAVYERKRNAKINDNGLNYGTTDLYSKYLPTDTTPYDIDQDYSILTNQALNSGNWVGAYNANAARNSKIDNEALPYAKNYMLDAFNPNFQSSVSNYQFTPYDLSQNEGYQKWDPVTQEQYGIVSNLKSYNSEEDQELQSLYGAISKQANDYMNSVFSYDLESDPLYAQYKDQYTTLGKEAMQDAMAQNAALTGGYGSSYSQGAGQQAYEHYLGRLNDVIPELYAQAYSQWADQRDREYNVINLMMGYGGTLYNQHRTDTTDANEQQWRLYDAANQNRQDALDTDYNIWYNNQNLGMQNNQQAWERELAQNELAWDRTTQSMENAYNRQQDARNFALGWIEQTGQLPPDSFLEAAGLTAADAQGYLDGLLAQAAASSSGGSGGGGGGRGRSYGGSGGYSYTPESEPAPAANTEEAKAVQQQRLEETLWTQLGGYARSGKKTTSQLRNMVMGWVGYGQISQEVAARMIYSFGLDKDNSKDKMVDGRQKM